MSRKDEKVKQASGRDPGSSPDERTGKHKVPLGRIRGIVILVAFLAIGISIAAHLGLGTVSSLGFGAISAICPVGALETFVASKLLIPRPVVTFLVIVALIIVLGRAFCSWICPVPPIVHFFHPRRTRDRKEHVKEAEEAVAVSEDDAGAEADAGPAPAADAGSSAAGGCSACAHTTLCGHAALPPMGGERDGRIVDSRHWVLGGALLSSAIFGFPVFCLVCPVGLAFATLIALWQAIGYQEPGWSLLVFPAVLVVELVLFRKWCHRFCPIGALMSLLNWGGSPVRPRVREKACLRSTKGIDCRVCVSACPEALDPHSPTIPECTKCGICVEECPANAITFGKVPRDAVIASPEPAMTSGTEGTEPAA